MKKPLALCAALVSSFAATAPAEASWTVEFTPTSVYAGYADGIVYIRGSNVGTCANKHTLAAMTDPDKVFSLALAALLSGKKVTCNLTGACTGSSPHEYSVVQQCQIVSN